MALVKVNPAVCVWRSREGCFLSQHEWEHECVLRIDRVARAPEKSIPDLSDGQIHPHRVGRSLSRSHRSTWFICSVGGGGCHLTTVVRLAVRVGDERHTCGPVCFLPVSMNSHS